MKAYAITKKGRTRLERDSFGTPALMIFPARKSAEREKYPGEEVIAVEIRRVPERRKRR